MSHNDGAVRFDGPLVSVVIPALNEAGDVGATVASVPRGALRSLGIETEVVVVDNGSTDGTAAEARAAGATVVPEAARGYGAACRAGVRAARGAVVVFADADNTYPLEDLPALLAPIARGQADLVTGSRLRGRIHRGAMPPLHRYLGVPLLTWMVNQLFGVGVSDGHCGLRALRRDAWARLRLDATGMEFATELLVEATRAGLRIAEVPIEYRPRRHAPSKLDSIRDGWRHIRWMIGAFLAAEREPVTPAPRVE